MTTASYCKAAGGQALAAPGGEFMVPGMLKARAHYETLGFAVVPIQPDRKKPLQGLTDWQRRRLDGEALDRHIRAGCGLGAVHGLSGTATLDGDGAEEHVTIALASVGVDFAELLSGGPSTVGNPDPEHDAKRRWARGQQAILRLAERLRRQDAGQPLWHP